MPVGLGIVVLLVLVYLGLSKKGKGSWASKRRTTSAYRSLLNMCLNDRHQADRLITAEKKRAPGISDSTACRRAIDRIKRANQ